MLLRKGEVKAGLCSRPQRSPVSLYLSFCLNRLSVSMLNYILEANRFHKQTPVIHVLNKEWMASAIPGLYLRSPPFLIYLFNTSNKISGRNLVSHPFLRRQFIFERIFSPPSTEVAAAVICHLLDNFCHQLAAKSTSAKTKSEDSYVGCLAGWVRAEDPPRLGLLWARPSLRHTPLCCARVSLFL